MIGMGTTLSHDQDLESYKTGCEFLPVLNNEFHKNSTYKKRFSSLENLVLIKVKWNIVLSFFFCFSFCSIAQDFVSLLSFSLRTTSF